MDGEATPAMCRCIGVFVQNFHSLSAGDTRSWVMDASAICMVGISLSIDEEAAIAKVDAVMRRVAYWVSRDDVDGR